MAKIAISDEWPIVRVTFPPGVVSDAEFEAYLRASDELIRPREARYALLVDCGLKPQLTPRQRSRQAEYLAEREPLMRRYCAGQAYVITSSINRGFLRAIFWLSPPPVEYRVFESVYRAREWLLEQLGVTESAAG